VERPETPVPVVRVGGNSSGSACAVAVVVALVLAMVVKPWQPSTVPASSAAAPDRSSPARVGVSAPAGTAVLESAPPCCGPDPTPPAPLAEQGGFPVCFSPDGWRIVADQVVGGTRSRVWLNVVSASIPSPAGAARQAARLVSDRVTALGFCAPVGLQPSTPWQAVLWSDRGTDGATAEFTEVAVLQAAADSDGVLLRGSGTAGTWALGRYVLQVLGGQPDDGAWLAVDLSPTGRP
jgi:hypothetical protein